MTTFFNPFQEFDRLAGSGLGRATASVMPVDLFREGDHYVLNADLPGIQPADVDVSVDGQTLTVRAERKAPAVEGAEWLARERPEASVVRQFTLGEGVDADNITANYDNGVLNLVIPVGERAKPRKIEIAGSAARPIEARQSKSAERDSGEQQQVVEDR
ncbi:MAG: Hsp20/alpha crystallin family protein [Actinomycetota bacterium]|nr:Hsp20/alpha crystallin family protein [Actinomycetota bacterium]